MADSLFDQEDNLDYLQELTKPGAKFDRSKYATEAEMYQAIAKGKYFGDKTIEMQNSRFDELRDDLLLERQENTAKDSFEQLRQTLLERKSNDSLPPKEESKSTLNPADLENFFQSKYSEMKMKEREEANLSTVNDRLKAAFGENAKTVFRDKMNTLGLSDEDIRYLAKKSPDAVMNALGLSSPQQGDTFEGPPRSSLRSDNFKPQVEIRDAVYYEKLRRENPKEYFSEKISVQRLKDMDHPDFEKRYRERQGQGYL